ncbi:MAG: tripartite tricarboxylate transporter substrate binding protein [Pseudomonadota bacterium]
MQNVRRRALTLLGVMAAITATFAAAPAMAQLYPSKPITIIVSYPPGGDTDALARMYAEKLSTKLGVSVVVDNKPGASGTIGNAYVAKAPADGYTLLFTPNTISIATLVLKSGSGAAYDVLTDFTPIIQAGSQSLFLVVNKETGITNVKQLVDSARAGKLKGYASPGSGSPMHILGETFNKAAAVKIAQVPYRGSGPAVVDLVGGHVPMFWTTLGPVLPHITSGKLVNIAVADPKRSPLQPNVPTLAEAGVADVNVGAWQGLMGPKGMPADVVRTLNLNMNDILKMPDVQAKMVTLALVPVGGEPATLGKLNAFDHNRYAKVIKEFGIQAE